MMYEQCTDWDSYFMMIARSVACKSKDDSTRVGAVIVGPDHEVRTTGYNGFPRGVNDRVAGRWERPIKYSWIEHAERNAVCNAARTGIPLLGCTAYVTHAPCAPCARALIQAGITTLVLTNKNSFMDGTRTMSPEFIEDHELALEMLDEAIVSVVWTVF